jgi:CO dehydrogenase nickel-insertion accessory protein CooC1
MTIATFGGAGNVGKTTVLEVISQEFARRRVPILGIDANPDQNLMEFAGLSKEEAASVPKLCTEFDMVKMLLDGGNSFYPDLTKVMATSPITEETKRWRLDIPNDAIVTKFGKQHEGIIHMHTGTYDGSRIGGGCMHDLIENLVYTVERLDDGMKGERGIVLIDQAHGRDAFGTPLYAQGDIALVVAEATEKSLGILADYIAMANEVGKKIGHAVSVGVIGNKIKNQRQIERIQEVAGEHYVTSLYLDNAFDRDFTNAGPKINELSTENQLAIQIAADHITSSKRDWNRRKDWLAACHIDAKWYDVFYGTDVREQKTNFTLYTPHVHSPNCGCHHG